jgi:hypothetical protein
MGRGRAHAPLQACYFGECLFQADLGRCYGVVGLGCIVWHKSARPIVRWSTPRTGSGSHLGSAASSTSPWSTRFEHAVDHNTARLGAQVSAGRCGGAVRGRRRKRLIEPKSPRSAAAPARGCLMRSHTSLPSPIAAVSIIAAPWTCFHWGPRVGVSKPTVRGTISLLECDPEAASLPARRERLIAID